MTLHGTIQSGVVVLDTAANLPDGTPVTVVVEQPVLPSPAEGERMTEEQRRKLLAALDAIASLPYESPGDGFSGRDHDKVLYGER